jgi:hypothetical protein
MPNIAFVVVIIAFGFRICFGQLYKLRRAPDFEFPDELKRKRLIIFLVPARPD